jgi:NYN domain
MTVRQAKQGLTPSVAFLIDADNLASSAIEEAFENLKQAGATVQIRRAYGGVEKLAGMKDVLRRHAVQAFVNQGKGTTDVALVVDAMDLLHRGALPSTVAIGSSDADFAPLAVRLREAGMLVICFAQKIISSDVLPVSYDKVIYVDSKPSVNQLPASPRESPVSAVAMPQRPAPVAALRSSTPKPVGEATQRLISTASLLAADSAAEDLAIVRRILAQFPDWLPNTIKQLNQLGAPVHVSEIKKGSKPLHELFRKYPAYFKVLPMTGPAKQIRLLKRP